MLQQSLTISPPCLWSSICFGFVEFKRCHVSALKFNPLRSMVKQMLQQSLTVSPPCLWSSIYFSFVEFKRSHVSALKFNPLRSKVQYQWFQPGRPKTRVLVCVCAGSRNDHKINTKKEYPQNVDFPPILPKNRKKPYPIPFKKIQAAGRADKKLAEQGIEKKLDPPKNGLLVPELVPVAYEVLEAWKVLIKGLAQLLHVIPVYGCSKCPEVHVGQAGHLIRNCRGKDNVEHRSSHRWVKGSVDDVLITIDSYHLFDPFGRRVRHETRFDFDRIPAVVELCIQAGVELPEYPSRRRTKPIRMLGKKVIDQGESMEDPKPRISQASSSTVAELNTYRAYTAQFPCPAASDVPHIAQETMKAYETVRFGVERLMKKYTVKACGYCTEVHVGPWGHNAKLCGEFKHQWRDGKHGWQDATVDEVFPPNYVWHVRDPGGPPLVGSLQRYYGKAPAVVEVCMQAGAEIPERYKPMMRLDIVLPDSEETRLVA